MGRGEIACFESHRNAWKEILKRNLDFGIVLEDDTAIDQVDIGKAVSCYTAFGNLSDFVSLQIRPLPSGGGASFHMKIAACTSSPQHLFDVRGRSSGARLHGSFCR